MSKRKDLIRTYDYFKTKSFYGIGQRKAKLFMNGLLKKLDSQIKTTPDDAQLMYQGVLSVIVVVLVREVICIEILLCVDVTVLTLENTT